MKATAEKLENGKVSLEIEVAPEQVEAALERAYRKVVKRLTIPGFRKGKAPRAVVERQYGTGILYEEALEQLVPEAYQQAVEQTEIEPIDQPQVDIVELEDGKPFRFKAEVTVKPEVQLGEYRGLKVTKWVSPVTDEQVDETLEQLRQQQAQLESVDRTTVEEGDFVIIDFEGFLDGQPFQGGAAKDFQLEIGSGQFIAGFEEQLVGAEVGQLTEVNVTFPEDYGSEDLAGKDAVFKVTVKSIKVRRLPELDDEFAKDVSDKDSLEELRALIRENLEEESERHSMSHVRDDLVNAATENAQVEVPDILVERQLQDMLAEFERNLMFRGMRLQDYLEMADLTEEKLAADMRPDAERRAKATLVLGAIIDAEGLRATDEEIQARIDELVGDSEGEAAERIRQRYSEPEMRDRLASSIEVGKAIDLLVNEAEVTEKEGSPHQHDHDHEHGHDADHDHDHGDDDDQAHEQAEEEPTSKEA